MLLEDISRKMENKPSAPPKDLEQKVKDYKRKSKLKMKLFEQDQKIERLVQSQFLGNLGLRSSCMDLFNQNLLVQNQSALPMQHANNAFLTGLAAQKCRPL